MSMLPKEFMILTALASAAWAQYGCVPGEVPLCGNPLEFSVFAAEPFPMDLSVLPVSCVQRDPGSSSTGFTADGAAVRFSVDFQSIVMKLHGDCEYVDLVLGPWGMNFNRCFNIGIEDGFSPSGRYFATGGDGTDVNRGPICFFDLEKGVLYSTGLTMHDNTGWIEGDMMLVEAVRPSDLDQTAGIADFPWINYTCMAGDGFRIRDIVLLQGDRAWAVLPDDSCYSYSLNGDCGLDDGILYFEVEASPNAIPSMMGWQTVSDFGTWVDSTGYGNAFPEFRFRIRINTTDMTVENIERIE